MDWPGIADLHADVLVALLHRLPGAILHLLERACRWCGRRVPRPNRHLPPRSWYTGMPARLPLMSQRAMSTPLMALNRTGPFRQYELT